MNRINATLFRFCTLLLMLLPIAATAAVKPVRVFILAGQSNMAGAGNVSNVPESLLPITDVLFDETQPGSPGSFSSSWETIGQTGANMGPEVNFAAAMRDAYPDETIAIIKVSRAGSGLHYWRTSGQAGHDTLMARISTISTRLNTEVTNSTISSWSFEGFIWLQGENEANGALSASQNYQTDFDELVQKVRTQTGVSNLPVVLARISVKLDPALGGPVNQPQLDNVRAAQVSWANNDDRGSWIDTDDLPLIDNYHFGSQGQLSIGLRFAKAWFELVEPRPALAISRATSQPAKSQAASITFEAVFGSPVSGFNSADVQLFGDTGADRVSITEIAPLDGTAYQISVTGMTQPGLVDLSVASGAAGTVIGSLSSLPGIRENTAVLWSPHSEVSNLLLYDPFEPSKRKLDNLQSGTGWRGNGWDVQNDGTGYTTGTTSTNGTSSSFAYPGLSSTPAHATGGDTFGQTARALDRESVFAPYMTSRTSGAVDMPGTTLWLSYLIRPINASAPQRVALVRGGGSNYSNNTVNIYQSGGTWRLLVLSSEVNTSIPVTANQTYLMVLRVHIGGDSSQSSAHLWINPEESSLGGSELSLVSATASLSETSGLFKFSRIHWYPGSQANSGLLDEIRIGTTYAAVTPSSTIPITFASWLSTNYPALTGNDALPTADPDADGLKNLLEFALGSNPTSAQSAPRPLVQIQGSHLQLTFTPHVLSGLTYIIQDSSNLSTWNDNDVTSALTVEEVYTFSDSFPIDGANPKRFLRLKVSE